MGYCTKFRDYRLCISPGDISDTFGRDFVVIWLRVPGKDRSIDRAMIARRLLEGLLVFHKCACVALYGQLCTCGRCIHEAGDLVRARDSFTEYNGMVSLDWLVAKANALR
jgi:hypothetical protein